MTLDSKSGFHYNFEGGGSFVETGSELPAEAVELYTVAADGYKVSVVYETNPYQETGILAARPDAFPHPVFQATVNAAADGNLQVVPQTDFQVRYYRGGNPNTMYVAHYHQEENEAQLRSIKAVTQTHSYIQHSKVATATDYHPLHPELPKLFPQVIDSKPVLGALVSGNYVNGHGPENITAGVLMNGGLLRIGQQRPK